MLHLIPSLIINRTLLLVLLLLLLPQVAPCGLRFAKAITAAPHRPLLANASVLIPLVT